MTKKPTAGIILAAGQSLRFGQPKQLIELKGKYLIQRVVETALESQLDKVVLVLGFEYQKINGVLGKLAQSQRIRVVINHDFRQGQSRSLQLGMREVKDAFASIMFLVADQPMLDVKTIDLLLDQFWHSPRNICVPICKGNRSNPTIFGKAFYKRLLQIEGDTGARQLIKAHPEDVLPVEVNNPLCFFDIDTPQDLEKLSALLP